MGTEPKLSWLAKVGRSYIHEVGVNGRGPLLLTPYRPMATRYGTPRDAHDACGRWGLPLARVVKLTTGRPRTFYPAGPFRRGDLVAIGREPRVSSEFYGGLARLAERTNRIGGVFWVADMLEPYRNGRYEFAEQYMMRIAKPMASQQPSNTHDPKSEEP